jgi:hypothetical protein
MNGVERRVCSMCGNDDRRSKIECLGGRTLPLTLEGSSLIQAVLEGTEAVGICLRGSPDTKAWFRSSGADSFMRSGRRMSFSGFSFIISTSPFLRTTSAVPCFITHLLQHGGRSTDMPFR